MARIKGTSRGPNKTPHHQPYGEMSAKPAAYLGERITQHDAMRFVWCDTKRRNGAMHKGDAFEDAIPKANMSIDTA